MSSSSNIKGGGRASMSNEVQEKIITLLQNVRDETNPLLPKNNNNKGDNSTLSNHDAKRNQKQFVKRLLECHERCTLSQQVNKKQTASSFAKKKEMINSSSSSGQKASNNSKKVRIQLVQAIPKKQSKKKSMGASSCWKEGSLRKVVVMKRSSTVEQVAQEAKSKLRLKQQPNRIFMVQNKVEVTLDSDLQAIKDGSVLYVMYQEDETSDKELEKTGLDANETAVPSESPTYDVLDGVKRIYAQQKRYSSANKAKDKDIQKNHKMTIPIKFSDSLQNLEPLSSSRAELPAAAFREKILTTLDTTRVLIICGETGCGKSTQVPQFILEGLQAQGQVSNVDEFHNDMVLVTQPRRLAAMSLADRVASERSCPAPGQPESQVGYVVRLDRAMSPSTTKLVYCTVGILVRMLVNDPNETDRDGLSLSRCCVLLIDEVHERDLNTDFCLTLLKILLQKQKNLKIVLMSATASPQLFVDYFGGNSDMKEPPPQVISIPGRTFPVATCFLPECESVARARLEGWNSGAVVNGGGQTDDDLETSAQDQDPHHTLSPRAQSEIDNPFICKLIVGILKGTDSKQRSKPTQPDRSHQASGSILVFLPGKGEIESLASTLRNDPVVGNKDRCRIVSLHSKTHRSEQLSAFRPVAEGTKIVLATNVAETSITIPDVSVVIDTGRVKESRFNSSTRINELTTVWTSQASATQRAGRAGRTGPGVCYKLYTSDFSQRHMPRRTSPEIFRTPLDELILQVCLLDESLRDAKAKVSSSQGETMIGTSPVRFLEQSPEPPTARQVQFACQHLLEAGALTLVSKDGKDSLFRLTPLGYHLSHLPMDAKVGKVLIVGCVLGCLEPSLTVAAALCTTKTCWLNIRLNKSTKETESTSARDLQEEIIRKGFGGESWRGGTVKGDIIGVIAAYNAWSSCSNSKERKQFARDHALDHSCLCEMFNLRNQFRQSLVHAGFLRDQATRQGDDLPPTSRTLSSTCNDDALLTSCCLVAGIYPNIATLLRPNKAQRIRGGRLITKDGSACRPSSSSFQAKRIRNASESGKDAYVVFHSKHRTVGTSKVSSAELNRSKKQREECFLSEINFVSRYSILLFGGEVEIKDNNAVIVDGWLKFKIGDKGQKTASVLLQELRKELDSAILKRITASRDFEDAQRLQRECGEVVQVVRELLAQE